MATDRHPRLDSLEHKHRTLHAAVDAEEARPRPDPARLTALKREKLHTKDTMRAFSNTLAGDTGHAHPG